MGMNKKTNNYQNNSSSSDNSQKSYEVQKIVNQRVINGKKQYKVIWAGYSFEEATWQPEQNLKCPDKINEFLKRYQDVIRRKNLASKSSAPPQAQNLSKSKADIVQKQNPQKPVSSNLIQQKLIPSNNETVNINKERLQASLQKSSLINQKKVADIENLKSKIMTPQGDNITKSVNNEQLNKSIQQTIMSQQNSQIKGGNGLLNANVSNSGSRVIVGNQQGQQNVGNSINRQIGSSGNGVPSKVNVSQSVLSSINTSKIIKIQQPSISSGIGPKSLNMNSSMEKNKKVEHKLQELNIKGTELNNQITEQQSGNQIVQNLGIKRKMMSKNEDSEFRNGAGTGLLRRLGQTRTGEMEQESKISEIEEQEEGWKQSEQQTFVDESRRLRVEKILGVVEMEVEGDLEEGEGQAIERGTWGYFLVKNRFSDREELVSRERLLEEQPEELIEFYEGVLSELEQDQN